MSLFACILRIVQSQTKIGMSRPAQVFVPEADYDRAYQLFYSEREDEL